MYWLTLNEQERKHELAALRKNLENAKANREIAKQNLAKWPDNAKFWNEAIARWTDYINNYARDMRRLVARDNCKVPGHKTA